ncbi:MAG: class I SAM-dependent methyltransferase [Burkholderiaceae bacterium]
MKTITLREGKERALQRRHPWIFDNAIAKGGGDSGETVRVESFDGKFLAWAAYSPSSKIRARAWSFDEAQRIDASFFIAACVQATRTRRLFDIQSDSMRLVHGESDGLPGLIVDRYGDTLVAQFLSAGVERWKQPIADALLQATGLAKLYERSDASSRALEGLESVTGWLRGGHDPAKPDNTSPVDITIAEHDYQLQVNIAEGHKTGFYLDQRDSRKKFAQYAQRLQFKRVLNCYCYTGGFTVAALAGLRAAGVLDSSARGGASHHITSIDSSGPAIERAKANVALNGFSAAHVTFMDADVNASLRQFVESGQTFDAIVLDPPKFAPTAAHADRAARAYKDINRLAFKILQPGGVLFTYSCSGGITADLFHKIVAGAGIDAGVDGYISERLGGAPDHPMTINFPEGEYLKGLIVVKKG